MIEGAGPSRILVVDDEPAILRFLRAGLSQPGLRGDRGGDGPGGAGRGAAAGAPIWWCSISACRTSTGWR